MLYIDDSWKEWTAAAWIDQVLLNEGMFPMTKSFATGYESFNISPQRQSLSYIVDISRNHAEMLPLLFVLKELQTTLLPNS